MPVYNPFAPREAERQKTWSKDVVCSQAWSLGAPIGSGVSNSLHVECETGDRGVAKPAFQPDGCPNAAHEKIAADLAFDLGVPVPPVKLWTDPGTGNRYAISLWAFGQAVTWTEAASALTPEYIAACKPVMDMGSVFHTWIGDGDRHGGNTLLDAAQIAPAVAFIDHAYALSWQWMNAAPPLNVILHGYATPVAPDPAAVADLLNKVQNVAADRVTEIVERIPPEYLSSDRKHAIVTNLLLRQRQIATLLGAK